MQSRLRLQGLRNQASAVCNQVYDRVHKPQSVVHTHSPLGKRCNDNITYKPNIFTGHNCRLLGSKFRSGPVQLRTCSTWNLFNSGQVRTSTTPPSAPWPPTKTGKGAKMGLSAFSPLTLYVWVKFLNPEAQEKWTAPQPSAGKQHMHEINLARAPPHTQSCPPGTEPTCIACLRLPSSKTIQISKASSKQQYSNLWKVMRTSQAFSPCINTTFKLPRRSTQQQQGVPSSPGIHMPPKVPNGRYWH